jgi:hypothetical protein
MNRETPKFIFLRLFSGRLVSERSSILARSLDCCASVFEGSIPFPQEGVPGLGPHSFDLSCFSARAVKLAGPIHSPPLGLWSAPGIHFRFLRHLVSRDPAADSLFRFYL